MVGYRDTNLVCWGAFDDPEFIDYDYKTMTEWGRKRGVTPGVAGLPPARPRRMDAGTRHATPKTPVTQPTSEPARPPIRFRGRSFEHLFAIRTQDELFPQRRVEDPLLSDADRRQLGIREIGDGRDEERLLFQLLLDGAHDSVRFSFATSDAFGKSRGSSFSAGPSCTSTSDAAGRCMPGIFT